jgi:hypothetical protein
MLMYQYLFWSSKGENKFKFKIEINLISNLLHRNIFHHQTLLKNQYRKVFH